MADTQWTVMLIWQISGKPMAYSINAGDMTVAYYQLPTPNRGPMITVPNVAPLGTYPETVQRTLAGKPLSAVIDLSAVLVDPHVPMAEVPLADEFRIILEHPLEFIPSTLKETPS